MKRNLLVFLRPTIMLDKAESTAATDGKYRTLWEVNLGIREKLGLPERGERPPIESLFQSPTLE